MSFNLSEVKNVATFTRIPNDKVNEKISVKNTMTGAVFSPSGRWAIDADRKEITGDCSAMHLNVMDMSAMTIRIYNAHSLKNVQNVMNMYWVSETEFVLVDLQLKTFTYHFIFCHLDHELAKVVPFRECTEKFELNDGELPRNLFKIQRNAGAQPVEFKGERFYLLNDSKQLVLVPWNTFYSDEQLYRMSIDIGFSDEIYSCFKTVFPYGSSIYIPMTESCETHGHHVYTRNIVKVDIDKVDFHDGYCRIVSDNPAASLIPLKQLNEERYVDLTEKMYFRQCEHYLIGYSKQRSVRGNTTQEHITERSIFIINLKENTVSYLNVHSSFNYFPTIYRDNLLIFDHVKYGENKWRMQFQKMSFLGQKVSTLQNLSHLSLFQENITISPDYSNILYPPTHCCPTHRKTCLCRGVLTSVLHENMELT